MVFLFFFFFFFQAEDGIRDLYVTGVQTCALPILFSPLFATRRPGVRIPSRPPDSKELNRLFGLPKVCQVCHLRPSPLPAGGRAAQSQSPFSLPIANAIRAASGVFCTPRTPAISRAPTRCVARPPELPPSLAW